MSEAHELPAGRFSSWIDSTLRAHATDEGVDVPCGSCTACCRSSYFIHIGPAETSTLRRIPPELLFPAPGLAEGHMVLGYDQDGCCPMLVDGNCSIYDDRPLTCRSYDCRVFAAAGLSPQDDGKSLITQQVRRWAFAFPSAADREQHAAVQAAAAFLREHPECFADDGGPRRTSEVAIAAVKVHGTFRARRDRPAAMPDVEAVTAAVRGQDQRGGSTTGSSPRATPASSAASASPARRF